MSPHTKERQEILEACLWLSDQGFFGSHRGSGGNVSVRLDRGLVALTPSSVPYRKMTRGDICLVGLDGRPLDVKAGRKPSIEAALHTGIYRNRPEINAVVHTHQPYASVFAVLNMPVPALFDEIAWTLGAQIDVIAYAPSGSAKLAENTVAKLSNQARAYIIQNHGILALGETLDQAVLNAELVEKMSHIYWMALATGKPVTRLPKSSLKATGPAAPTIESAKRRRPAKPSSTRIGRKFDFKAE